jgi:hypothetical protein
MVTTVAANAEWVEAATDLVGRKASAVAVG